MRASIPTTAFGIEFRSRLEAKYATFFELLEFKWQYEPVDLNGWIPDFILYGEGGREVFVEIKPETDREKLQETFSKINKSLAVGNVCVLTPGFFCKYPDIEGPFCLGYIRTTLMPDDSYFWDEVAFKPRPRDICDRTIDFTGRLTGVHNTDKLRVDLFFKEAGNRVQWFPK